MNEERYQRQINLNGFGIEGQQKLNQAKVLVVGAGGLGVPVLTYLNAMGVGTLGIVDADVVSLSNLHRQVLYTEDMVGTSKVLAAKDQLLRQNSNTQIETYQTYLTVANALDIIKEYDVIVDATDNFPTRYLINDACVIENKPFVYGALHAFEGQVSVFNYLGGPTYRCLFPTMPAADAVPNCNENGVLGILPGIIGNLQTLEVVKIIAEIGEVLSGVLLIFDTLTQRTQQMKFKLQPGNNEIKTLATSYEFDCELPLKSVKAEEFNTILMEQAVELIDVRTVKEFQRQHLKEAKHIPLGELTNRVAEVDLETTVYVICQSGVRSKKAIIKMQELFPGKDFVIVSGGMNQMKNYVDTY
ncbi:adenylyltransferase/sulfurtransferase [Maribacter spongiicola]|uniref:Molybdopterin-synthase adenylyltransferase n=1 Tax=Maribacter spongiicola TaxID=1206753 RepID=A0A4R7K2L4_9FLAO|nr:HesA/MoeB/ThiF family protein [Maribacter spongiicola]TDT44664.1 adenylyltransferase/sulfurtransferase [Maribacter spongiicola]